MEKILTLEEAQALIGHVFVYQMPFNQLIGLELIRFEQDYPISLPRQTGWQYRTTHFTWWHDSLGVRRKRRFSLCR